MRLLSLLVLLIAAAPALAQPSVLLLTDSDGFVHGVVKPPEGDNLVATTVEQIVASMNGTFARTDDAADVAGKLGETDVLVMYTTGPIPLDVPAVRQFVENGGGLVGIHCATDTLKEDEAFYTLIGGTFDGHPWNADDSVVLRGLDARHPVSRPIGGRRALKEEIYKFRNFDPSTVRVLVSLDTEATPKKVGGNVPVVWVKQVGDGRVVYTSLGHRPDVWKSQWYQDHLSGAIRFTAGEVDGSVAPNPVEFKRQETIGRQERRSREPDEDERAPTTRPGDQSAAPEQGSQAAQAELAAQAQSDEVSMNENAQADDGFTTLFDGSEESLDSNWRGYKKEDVPEPWQVQDETLALTRGGAGDLITKQKYEDFDLRFEWNISERGNSGVIYRVAEEGPNTAATFQTGFEFQLLDDAGYPNWPRDHLSGALYDLYPAPESSRATRAGEWNTSRIVVNDGRITHYLNGQLVAETRLGSDDWKEHLANSKFADWPRFGKVERGHIALQDHGNPVRFRNIRIKPLD